MALITCPECGKEVSDKAVTCPHCGNPLNKEEETVLLCPHCGNKDIIINEQGFSGLKSAAGFITFGAVGALLGTHKMHDVKCTCKNCGKEFKLDEANKKTLNAVVGGKEITTEDLVVKILKEEKLFLKAVDLYKEREGVSLIQAKNAVDDIIKRNNIDDNKVYVVSGEQSSSTENNDDTAKAIAFIIAIIVSLIVYLAL